MKKKISQDELFSICKSEHSLRVYILSKEILQLIEIKTPVLYIKPTRQNLIIIFPGFGVQISMRNVKKFTQDF